MTSNSKQQRPIRQTTAQKKPAKPDAHFPMFSHASGRWAKKSTENYFISVAGTA